MYYIIMKRFLGWNILEVKNGVATLYARQIDTEEQAREMAEYLTEAQKEK